MEFNWVLIARLIIGFLAAGYVYVAYILMTTTWLQNASPITAGFGLLCYAIVGIIMYPIVKKVFSSGFSKKVKEEK